jgi:hypothetical protein
MKELKTHLDQLEKNDCALFDVDMVLIQPKEPAFQMANMKRYRFLVKKIAEGVPLEKRDIFWNLMTIHSDSVLISPEILEAWTKLKDQKIASIALTACLTGKFAHIENMQRWKIDRLKALGIDFAQTAPYLERIVFEELPSYRGYHSIYEDGMLFVNGTSCSKGRALIAFLNKTRFSPKKIVFIDDRREHVKSVEESLKRFDPKINYVGIHFIGAREYDSFPISEAAFKAKWEEIARLAEAMD